MSDLARYHSFIASSDRWDGFEFRDDDVIISTPAKSGTTWLQTMVALLLFDGVPDEPVYDLSPWLDMNLRPRQEVHDLLARQEHRRFIKTHTPLDGLPLPEEVTVLTVVRDPRDVFVSMRHHGANIVSEETLARRIAAVGGDDLPTLPDPWPETDDDRALVAAFLDLEPVGNTADVSLAHLLHHVRLAWAARDDERVHLFHFGDLKADLAHELRVLRNVLGTPQSDERVAQLSAHATLTSMRARAERTAPEANMGVWQDPAGFFRGGRRGDGAAMMTADELARYEERVVELAGDPELVTWLHGGWAALPGQRPTA